MKDNDLELVNKVESLLGENFSYRYDCVESDYDDFVPCQNGSSCCDGDYCRCRKITNYEVKSINFIKMALEISKEKEMAFILSWWINHNVHKDDFNCEVAGDYYGDECGPIRLPKKLQEDVAEKFTKFLSKNDTFSKKVQALLQLEYGTLSEHTKDVEWKLEEVLLDDVFDNTHQKYNDHVLDIHNKELSRLKYSEDGYLTKLIPVCLEEGSKFRLVDGRHRFKVLSDNLNKDDVIIICCGVKK